MGYCALVALQPAYLPIIILSGAEKTHLPAWYPSITLKQPGEVRQAPASVPATKFSSASGENPAPVKFDPSP